MSGYEPDSGAFIRTTDGSWELNPYAMVQLQNVSSRDPKGARDSGYALRSAKFILHGHIYDPSLTYHFQINAGDGKVAAEDIYLLWSPTRSVGLLVGQFEVPFNRQHITLEAYQQLIDRSIVDQRYNLQRDMGAAVYLADEQHTAEATIGMWNGSRQDAPNDNGSYLWTGRLAWNPWGPIAFREADLDDSPRPRLSIAAAGAYNPDRIVPAATTAASATELRDIRQGVGEITLRYRGLSLSVEAHARRQQEAGKQKSDRGGFVQAGYFLVPRRVEIVARAAEIGGDLAATDTAHEQTAGINYYLRGHRFKLQADASRLELHGGGVSERLRFQLEFFL
jgi:hypothetical protein